MAKANVLIDLERCKGCEICVKLCPTETLHMQNFKAAVKDIDKCTVCMNCELRCPDFAITVTRLTTATKGE